MSDNGILAYQARADKLTEPVWADRSGEILESLSEPGIFTGGSVSRDGQKIAFVIDDPRDDTTNIWSYDVSRHLKARLTFEPHHWLLPDVVS